MRNTGIMYFRAVSEYELVAILLIVRVLNLKNGLLYVVLICIEKQTSQLRSLIYLRLNIVQRRCSTL